MQAEAASCGEGCASILRELPAPYHSGRTSGVRAIGGLVGHLASVAALPEVCPQMKRNSDISPTSPLVQKDGWTADTVRPPDLVPEVTEDIYIGHEVEQATTPAQTCSPASDSAALSIFGCLVRPPESFPCDFGDSDWESLGPTSPTDKVAARYDIFCLKMRLAKHLIRCSVVVPALTL